MITLSVLQGRASGSVFDLDAPRITIGRSPSNQVVLQDPHLAGEHGQIFREADHYIYQDLGSPHGSRLRRGGDELLLDGSAEARLQDGDQLCLGDPREPVVLACRVRPDPLPPTDVRELIQKKDPEEAAAELEREPAAFKALFEASKRLSRSSRLEVGDVFRAIADAVFDLLPRVTHVSIDCVREQGWESTEFTAARSDGASSGARSHSSRSVVNRVLAERAGIWLRDARTEIASPSQLTAAMDLQSVLAVPLWEADRIRYVLQADNRGRRQLLTGTNLAMLMVLGGQAGLAIENAQLVQRARGESRFLKRRDEERFPGMVGGAPSMQRIFDQIDKVKDTRATVCIEGETGTGKELVARAIHQQGNRKDKLFVAQNCAALPENLLESELFGHKKGAFTGADHDKKGLFEIADGGTLFLDEIGEMSLGLQAKLLRVLQEGEVRPVGATAARKVDVRIICATHRSLEKEVEKGAFRQDLYYRLHVYPIRVPPLRERRDDIPDLVRHFLARYSTEIKKPVEEIDDGALDQLKSHDWPGNIRQLENEVQRLVIQAEPGMAITADMLSPQIRKVEGLLGRVAPKKGTLKDMMEEVERWLLIEALRDHGGNKTKTAETLGITREGLHKKLSKFGL